MADEPRLKLVGGTTVSNGGDAKASPPGGGSGGMDGTDTRLKRLEDDTKEARADLKAIRIDLAEIKGKLSGMPSTWQIVGICATLIGIAIASSAALLAILRTINAG